MYYRDVEEGTIYKTKEIAKEAYINNSLSDPWWLAEIAFDHGPTLTQTFQWIKSMGLMDDFYNRFKANFEEGAKRYAEMWADDCLEEIDV